MGGVLLGFGAGIAARRSFPMPVPPSGRCEARRQGRPRRWPRPQGPAAEATEQVNDLVAEVRAERANGDPTRPAGR